MYKNILVPVVLGEGHNHDLSFAAARQLASDDARFTVLYVREPIPAYVAAEIPQGVLADSRSGYEDDLKQLAAALPEAEPAVINGSPGRGIVDYAEANGIDCIVIASHKPGLQNLVIGSTANKVVHHAKCTVHVIR
ncbi:MAG: universal stress protein [Litoreibacter sp.]|nr:universal stress protein [Litoreibacter sp.]